jgi:ElaB/YqjD/DUF883 family membrane-anchored ribosome-binding protein
MTTQDAKEQVSAIAEQGRTVANKAADTADRAADTIRDGSSKLSDAGDSMAGRLEQASEHMRATNTQELRGEVARYLEKHPFQALAFGLAVGIVLARLLR